jgi:hypothetical protein
MHRNMPLIRCPNCKKTLKISVPQKPTRFRCQACKCVFPMSPDPQHRVASPIDELIAKISTWYTTGVKPLLGELHEPKLSELDADLANLLRTAEECDGALEVCFLGMAGVGKSTIINALAFDKEMVLPTGGVGPLTAQAMSVRDAVGVVPLEGVEAMPSLDGNMERPDPV